MPNKSEFKSPIDEQIEDAKNQNVIDFLKRVKQDKTNTSYTSSKTNVQ